MRRLSAAAGLLVAALSLFVLITPAAQPAAAGGRPLRYLAGAVGTLDPAFISDAGDVQLLLQLYAGLTRIDEEGLVYASLAETWEVSDEGRTYTFRLRDDLHFSDGAPLTSADIRRSWLRILDPATRALAPDVLNVIEGAAAWRAGTGSIDEVGITTPDAQTLVVQLEHPASHFLALAATPTASVVPPHADASTDWQSVDQFVGSGPYAVERTDGANLVLAANPEYVAGPPPIGEVVWVAEVETSAPEAFAADEVDLVNVFSGDASWIRYDETLGQFLHEAASLSVQYFGFDTTQSPFDDARVRRAFSLALERARLVELQSGPAATAATSLVPPALWPDGPPTDADPDPAEARRLLEEAGYASGADLGTITVNATGLAAGPAVAVWREELGVDIAIESMGFEDFLTVLPQRPPPVYTINWITDYPSPYALYGLLLLPDAASNYGRWNDAEFVELMEVAARATDPDDQRSAYLAVEARVDAEAPVIPWSWDASHWLVRDGLNGVGTLTVGLLDFGRVSWAD
jgi:oligopeptide transport system substrate-binding protein